MSQTSYSQLQLAAFAGQLYDIGPHDIYTYAWLGTANLPFGSAVVQDSLDNRCRLPAASSDVTSSLFAGVVIATQAVENPIGASGTTPGGYPKNSAVSVMHKGRVWVSVEEAVTTASPVFVRFAANAGAGFNQLGTFRASADTANAAQLPKARFLSSAAAGGFAILEINQP
jgi:hypothetical protein